MIVYISLEYSSEGPAPSEIDRMLGPAGVRRQGAFFYLEVPREDDLASALDRLHAALQGTGVRYHLAELSEGTPAEASDPAAGGGRQEARPEAMDAIVAQLRDTGGSDVQQLRSSISLDDEELEAALERLMDDGLVTAHFEGKVTIYHHAGPMLRSLRR